MIEFMIDTEQWKAIEGYDGLYEVSDLGRVRSRKSGEWRMLRFGKSGCGYLQVWLSKDGKVKQFKVHRLVASAFIDNNNIVYNEINHINENKADNRAVNLEWCNRQYNNTYNDIHHRRITKRDKIKELYDPNLTYEQNLDVFKANGIECCGDTVRRLRRDLGLINT